MEAARAKADLVPKESNIPVIACESCPREGGEWRSCNPGSAERYWIPSFAGTTPGDPTGTRSGIRRARPLLGTFVEIAVAGATIPVMEAAVEAAFAAVATVHRLMSFHEAESDVSRLNRDACLGAAPVHEWTYLVLETALDLHWRSNGMFDVAVAPALQKLGLLPCTPAPASPSPSPSPRVRGPSTAAQERRGEATSPPAQLRRTMIPSPLVGEGWGGGSGSCGNAVPPPPTPTPDPSPQGGEEFAARARDLIQLLPRNHVRFAHRGVTIDLGGIAKGFAVDRAIEALRRRGVTDGLVNAGGDLAAFGPRCRPVDIRDPRSPGRSICRVKLNNAALASSAGRFDPSRSDLPSCAAVIDPLTRRPNDAISAATVCASRCVVADALTKVVMTVGEGAAALLEHYGASALFMTAQGCVHMTTDWKNEVRFAA